MEITYALIICVENYNLPDKFNKVSFAIKDGQDLQNTLINIGISSENIKLIYDKDATKNSILSELKILSRRVTKDDRILFFYSGHGTYIESENYIIPADAYPTNLKETCISISTIIEQLKKSNSSKKILFLDCCHSGFEPSDDMRDIDTSFLADELIYNYRNEEYCCGFASSKSHEKSISHLKLTNGVWTHFLLKALNGEAGNIYEHGILFSDKLQSFLNKNVTEFVKLNTSTKRDQTPIVFGNQTDRFIIADLNLLFDEKSRNKVVSDVSFTNISLLSEEDGNVKSLPDFQKGYHSIPTTIYYGADAFIKKIGSELISTEIGDLSKEIRKKLKYKRTEIEVDSNNGSGAIVTPDFTYTMEIKQSENNASEYILIRNLEGFKNSSIILEKDFNEIFSRHFDKLEFKISKTIDIENLIDLIENIDDEESISVEYDDTDLTSCTLSIKNLEFEIEISEDSFTILSNDLTSPEKLILAYKKTHQTLLSNPSLNFMLE